MSANGSLASVVGDGGGDGVFLDGDIYSDIYDSRDRAGSANGVFVAADGDGSRGSERTGALPGESFEVDMDIDETKAHEILAEDAGGAADNISGGGGDSATDAGGEYGGGGWRGDIGAWCYGSGGEFCYYVDGGISLFILS